jgi:hypothetical protein
MLNAVSVVALNGGKREKNKKESSRRAGEKSNYTLGSTLARECARVPRNGMDGETDSDLNIKHRKSAACQRASQSLNMKSISSIRAQFIFSPP